MGKGKYIVYCDRHGIKDGILREMLVRGNITEAKISIQNGIYKREDQIYALKELRKKMYDKMERLADEFLDGLERMEDISIIVVKVE